MNLSFVQTLLDARRPFVATVVGVEGHSYKPEGHRALYECDGIRPLHGNLGSLCVDREILRQGQLAWEEGNPRRIAIDMSKPADAHAGHGAFCGGKLELLVEPVGEAQREVYRALQISLRKGERCALIHDLQSGELSIRAHRPAEREGMMVEIFPALPPLWIFGATPLTEQLLPAIGELALRIHVVDWRPAHLEALRAPEHVVRQKEMGELDSHSLLLVLSHDYERDLQAIHSGLAAHCRWIGVLSSRVRRDRLFEELRARGVDAAELERIACPVGLAIGGRSDAEIAISIAAQLVGELQ